MKQHHWELAAIFHLRPFRRVEWPSIPGSIWRNFDLHRPYADCLILPVECGTRAQCPVFPEGHHEALNVLQRRDSGAGGATVLFLFSRSGWQGWGLFLEEMLCCCYCCCCFFPALGLWVRKAVRSCTSAHALSYRILSCDWLPASGDSGELQEGLSLSLSHQPFRFYLFIIKHPPCGRSASKPLAINFSALGI